MEGTYQTTYSRDQLPEWIMEQLTMGMMPCFFPASFCEQKNCISAVFQTAEYQKLSRIDTLSTSLLVHIIGQTAAYMEENERHYLFSDRYRVDGETVYVQPHTGNVKLIYEPVVEGDRNNVPLETFVQACLRPACEEGQLYVSSLLSFLRCGNHSYHSIIRRCKVLQEEIELCDIP